MTGVAQVFRMLGTTILPLATRHVLRRRLTAGVAVVGLACGVGAIAASQMLYGAVLSAYETTIRGFAGRAALQVTNGDSGVAEELADELRRVPGVQAVVASAEGWVATPDLPGERLYLYGVDLLADQEVRDYGAGTDAVVSDPMVFLAAADSVALTSQFMRAHALAMHDHLRVLTPAGAVALTIRAALGMQRGPATVLDGRLAVVDLSVAQELLQLDRRVSELAITVAAGADVAAVERAVVARVGLRGTVEPPRSRAAAFGRLLGNYRNGLTLASTLAMLVALYFVFNLATIAVEDRRREIALLRLAGMSAATVTSLILAEVIVLSLAGTALGLPLGCALAHLLSSAAGSGVAALYADVGDLALRCDAGAVLWSLVVGIVAPLGAAVGPLRRTLGIRPLAALRTNVDAGEPAPATVRGLLLGSAVIAGAVIMWMGRAHLPFTAERTALITMLGVAVGGAVSLPGLLQMLAVGSDEGIARLGRIVALLAARNVACDMRRLTVTCAAVVVSLAGTIAIATWISSLDGTLADAFETVFGRIDLVVSGGADPFAQDGVRIPRVVADELAGWSEVAFVDPVRVGTIALAGSRAAVVASDARLYRDGRRTLSMVDGDTDAAVAALASGTAVVVNQVFARRFGRRLGDALELATPGGRLRVPIVGIHLELTPGDLGTIRLDRALYRRWWRDETATVLEVSLRPDADRQHVASAIRARWGAQYRLVVLTTEQLRGVYGELLQRLTGLVYPLLAVALGCALVGVVSTGVATALARRRVIATLRAVGCTRRQVAAVFGLESALVGAIAAATAAIAGSGLGWLQVEVLMRGTLGMSVLYAYPLRLAVMGGSGVVIVTTVCGWLVGARAGRPMGSTVCAE